MLGTTTYVLFHSAVIAKFPQKLYGGIQDGTLEISCVSILRESKTNSQICMAALFRSPTMYVQKVSENSASTHSSQKIIWELCFVIVIAFAATTSNVVSQARHFL